MPVLSGNASGAESRGSGERATTFPAKAQDESVVDSSGAGPPGSDAAKRTQDARSTWSVAGMASTHAVALWLAGPPLLWWPLCFLSIVPLLWIALRRPGRGGLAVYLAAAAYWFASLQGLRYAHPLMIGPLLALVAYLAVYPLLFVVLLRQAVSNRWLSVVPVPWTAAVVWVGLEWIRNHFATGISVLMLGHALVDVPTMVQIADCFGTYGVSFVIVLVNGALWQLFDWPPLRRQRITAACSLLAVIGFVLASWWYGTVQLAVQRQPTGANVLLIGRNDRTEYVQDAGRQQEIFSAYAAQTIEAVRQSPARIDVVVWPESMFSGGMAWVTSAVATSDDTATAGAVYQPAPGVHWTAEEAGYYVAESQTAFRRRAKDLQRAMGSGRGVSGDHPPPSIIGGCPLVRIGPRTEMYSGIVQVNQTGEVAATYAKNHLVLFGETIPLVNQLPILRDMVPPGLGLDRGSGPERFDLPQLSLLPNLCIETAVERVAADHLRTLWRRSPERPLPDAIVTVTNDAWFDHSTVVEHHLRCARMVAVATRRPILSAANGGPTAWVDSRGAVVARLRPGQDGHLLVQPLRDPRTSLYVRYGAVPAGAMGVVVAASLLINMLWQIPRLVSRVSRWRSRFRASRSGRGGHSES